MVINTGFISLDNAVQQAEKSAMTQAEAAKKLALDKANKARLKAENSLKTQQDKASKLAEKPAELAKEAEALVKQAEAIVVPEGLPLVYSPEYLEKLEKQAKQAEAKKQALKLKADKLAKQAEATKLQAEKQAEQVKLAEQAAAAKIQQVDQAAAAAAIEAEDKAKKQVKQAEDKASKQAEKLAELAEKLKAQQAELDREKGTSKTPEYDSQGRLIIETNLPENLCQVLNVVADSVILENGKLVWCQEYQQFSQKQLPLVKTLAEQGYILNIVKDEQETGVYSMTGKGLAVFNQTFESVLAYLASFEPEAAAPAAPAKQGKGSKK